LVVLEDGVLRSVEAVPAVALGLLAVSLPEARAVVDQHVVFSRDEELGAA